MPPITPPSVTALPTPPSTASPSTFDTRADAFLGSLPTYQTENNALAANVYANAVDAASSATAAAASVTSAATQVSLATTQADAAAASAVAAAASAGAATWANTGATYAIGDLRRSPVNSRIYRRLTASNAGSTDPSVDTTNWAIYSLDPIWSIKSSNYTATAGDAIWADTSAGTFTVTLPASPVKDYTVRVGDYQGTFGTNKVIIGRNGSPINKLAQDLDITNNWACPTFTYVDATVGWRTS